MPVGILRSDLPPQLDELGEVLLKVIATDSQHSVRSTGRSLRGNKGQRIGDDLDIRQLPPIPSVLFGQDHKAIIVLDRMLIELRTEKIDHTPQPTTPILQALELGEMIF